MVLWKLTPIVIMFILSDSVYFSSVEKIVDVIGLTAAGAAMTKDGVGTAGGTLEDCDFVYDCRAQHSK